MNNRVRKQKEENNKHNIREMKNKLYNNTSPLKRPKR